jgi:hypothetical protein
MEDEDEDEYEYEDYEYVPRSRNAPVSCILMG